jgi:hypothetical protein
MNRQQLTERADMARELLEAGLSVPAVVIRLKVQFGISQSSAYTDVHKAEALIAKSDDGPVPGTSGWYDTPAIISSLLYDAQVCQASGNIGDASKCYKAADLLRRWGMSDNGPEQQHPGPGFARPRPTT